MNLHSARDATRRALAHAPGPGAITIALGVAAALGGAALYNRAQARRAERENPPVGRFLEVDGTRLHYLDEGPAGAPTPGIGGEPPVALLHGNTVTLDDWIVSRIFDLIARSRRVVARSGLALNWPSSAAGAKSFKLHPRAAAGLARTAAISGGATTPHRYLVITLL